MITRQPRVICRRSGPAVLTRFAALPDNSSQIKRRTRDCFSCFGGSLGGIPNDISRINQVRVAAPRVGHQSRAARQGLSMPEDSSIIV